MTEAAPSVGGVFVSYRRDDAAYPAGWLVDRLVGRFGVDRVFRDVDSIQPGDDFVEDIMTAVGSCAVLLAVIGVRWLAVTGEDGRRRIDDPEDFVRLEIEAALARNVRVIPVLVDGARMPSAADLPASLQGLARRQALELSPANFDTSRLLAVLESTLTGTTAADRADEPGTPAREPGKLAAGRDRVTFNNSGNVRVGGQFAEATEVTVYMGARPEPEGADADPAPDSGDEPDA
jgi:TIR domain